MRELKGKVAVVTGAGHGIGRETALALAHQGCRLAICDVNEAALEGVRHELEQLGATVTAHVVDVSDKTQIASFASEVIARHGEAHIVNLSNVFGIIAPPLQTSYVASKFAARADHEGSTSG